MSNQLMNDATEMIEILNEENLNLHQAVQQARIENKNLKASNEALVVQVIDLTTKVKVLQATNI